MKETREKEI